MPEPAKIMMHVILAIDTLTSLFFSSCSNQSPVGFIKAGGFKGIYNGLSSAIAGSAPSAALFFSTYETVKGRLTKNVDEKWVTSSGLAYLFLLT
jgi:hypothetical protein